MHQASSFICISRARNEKNYLKVVQNDEESQTGLYSTIGDSLKTLVSFAAVFWDVTQRSPLKTAAKETMKTLGRGRYL